MPDKDVKTRRTWKLKKLRPTPTLEEDMMLARHNLENQSFSPNNSTSRLLEFFAHRKNK